MSAPSFVAQTATQSRIPRVLIVAEHASASFGGEAVIPLHYFRILSRKGAEPLLVVHERTRHELEELFPEHKDRIYTIRDTPLSLALFHLAVRLPVRFEQYTLGFVTRSLTQVAARKLVRELVPKFGIEIVHQPIPVSPKEPSFIYDVGAPVIMGPINGAIDYPPAFRHMESPITDGVIQGGRAAAHLINRFIPGKLKADTVLVANERSRDALPRGLEGRIRWMTENGVDLSIWSPPEGDARRREPGEPARFAFLGRLIPLKGVDIAIEALAKMRHADARLTVVGDGPSREEWEGLARRLGLEDRVTFTGWLKQAEAAIHLRDADALLMPSLHESGGNVVLEAMATSVPVIAVDWGGPADYVSDACGFLVPPTGKGELVEGFAERMDQLAADPELARRLGAGGRRLIEEEYDWDRKVDVMIGHYHETIALAAK
ncbi:MAG: glycosyltransferase family 4 protein [Sandaracinaceae bacterium]